MIYNVVMKSIKQDKKRVEGLQNKIEKLVSYKQDNNLGWNEKELINQEIIQINKEICLAGGFGSKLNFVRRKSLEKENPLFID